MEWIKGEVSGTTYGLSGNGWMDMELFKMWFLIISWNMQSAYALYCCFLMVTVHTTTLEAIRLARDNDVIIFTLVPHTTHMMQPLDKAVFGPLKVHWWQACHNYLQSNPSKVITKYNVGALLNTAWMKTMTPQTIVNGFRSCGVLCIHLIPGLC